MIPSLCGHFRREKAALQYSDLSSEFKREREREGKRERERVKKREKT